MGELSHLHVNGSRALPSPGRPDQTQQSGEISVGIRPCDKVHPAPLKEALLLGMRVHT